MTFGSLHGSNAGSEFAGKIAANYLTLFTAIGQRLDAYSAGL
jgi:hypothetical protein